MWVLTVVCLFVCPSIHTCIHRESYQNPSAMLFSVLCILQPPVHMEMSSHITIGYPVHPPSPPRRNAADPSLEPIVGGYSTRANRQRGTRQFVALDDEEEDQNQG